MASTITIDDTIAGCLPYVQNRPLNIGLNSEPAVTMANTVLQTILGPPFCWRWNRKTVASFNTASGTADYSQSVPDFGFLEKATIAGTEGEIVLNLGTETGSGVGRPAFCAPYLDDNNGNITFRLQPIPDAVYPINLTYQAKPSLALGTSGTWSPIPDEYEFIYFYGFLALAFAYAEDPRFLQFSQMFKGHLLGAAEGLSETQISVFMNRWDRVTSNTQASGLKTQQGVQGRAL